jgi:uncharacterized membrane protein YfcA
VNWGVDSMLPVVGAFLAAGLVKGVVGLGLPTVAMAVLGTFMPPAQAAALLLLPGIVTNVWQMFSGPAFVALARRFGLLLVGSVLGTLLSPIGLAGSGKTSSLWLGLTLIAYALFSLSGVRPSVSPRAERWLSPLAGLASGAVNAATGVFVIPVAPYLQTLGLDKDQLVQGLAVSFTVATIAMGVRLHMDGVAVTSHAAGSTAALVAALLGMQAGQWLRARASEAAFRRYFFVGLAVTGVFLTAKGLSP